jgi:excinuclease UvrABC nuclease subunit
MIHPEKTTKTSQVDAVIKSNADHTITRLMQSMMANQNALQFAFLVFIRDWLTASEQTGQRTILSSSDFSGG